MLSAVTAPQAFSEAPSSQISCKDTPPDAQFCSKYYSITWHFMCTDIFLDALSRTLLGFLSFMIAWFSFPHVLFTLVDNVRLDISACG